MSNWPPPVATSEVTFWRRVFSGNVTYLTLIPYLLVNLELRACITIMSGLFTVAIVSVGWPCRTIDWAVATPTSTARLRTMALHRPTAKRDTRMLAPFIGLWLAPTIGAPPLRCERPTRFVQIDTTGPRHR